MVTKFGGLGNTGQRIDSFNEELTQMLFFREEDLKNPKTSKPPRQKNFCQVQHRLALLLGLWPRIPRSECCYSLAIGKSLRNPLVLFFHPVKETFRFHTLQVKNDRLLLILSGFVSQVTDLYGKCKSSQHARNLDFIVVTSI